MLHPRHHPSVSHSLCLIYRLHVAQLPCLHSCSLSVMWPWPVFSHSDLKPVRSHIKNYWKPGAPLLVFWCALSTFQQRDHHTNPANTAGTPEASLKISQVLQKSNAKPSGLWPIHSVGTKCLLRLNKALRDNEMKWLDLQMWDLSFPSSPASGSDYFYRFSKQRRLFPLLQWAVQMHGLEGIFSGRHGYH